MADLGTSPSGQGSRRTLYRRIKMFQMRARGFSGRGARWWIKQSAGSEGLSPLERRRALRWGFLPETVERFAITEDNRASFVSARDYAFVQPFNGKYGKWVRDRISALTVLSPFTEIFETVHFHFFLRDGDLMVIPISSAAQQFDPSLAGVVEFVHFFYDSASRNSPSSHTAPHDGQGNGGLAIRTSAFESAVDHSLTSEKNSLLIDGQRLSLPELHTFLLEAVSHHSLVL